MTLTTLGVSAANVANVANRTAHTEEVGVTVTPPAPPPLVHDNYRIVVKY